MLFWWVNQNQTFRHEFAGGYLWSPKRNANGARNPFYEFMREVSPGDVVLSFVDTKIGAIGTAQSYCYEGPKPQEFGKAGQNWENIGWQIRVRFVDLLNKIRPKDYIDVLRHVLPPRYSPLQPDGNGLQSVYLAEISVPMAEVILGLIGPEAQDIVRSAETLVLERTMESSDDLDYWEHQLEKRLTVDPSIVETDRRAIISTRCGQGLFKRRVMQIEKRCRLTLVDNSAHLLASHCKPWRDATNEERLDGEIGLLLTPSIDHLFDRGFISFEDTGTLIVSPVAHRPSLQRMGVETERKVNVGGFTEGQKKYLDFHRTSILLRAIR